MIRAPAEAERSIKSVADGSRAEKHDQRHLRAVSSPNEPPSIAKPIATEDIAIETG